VSFTWPLGLLALLAVPLVLGIYVLAMRRRRRQAVTYSSLALLRSVIPARSRWRRHVPVGLLLGSLGVLGIAAARPQVTSDVAVGRTSIILAMDVSRSMCSTDVSPNRLAAAQKAAKEFVQSQPQGVRMGLVVFSGFAQEAVAPTTNKKSLVSAIDGLATARGTAIGAAMLKALDAIAEVNPNVKPVGDTEAPPTVQKSGDFVPDVIVLLTDGANTQGIGPLDAVPYAVARKVRVYTIGLGTPNPATLECSPEQLGGDTGAGGFGFGGGGGGGRGFGGFGGRSPLQADLPTLQQVADQTGGQAFTAEDAPQLSKVFGNLPKNVTVQKTHHEISATFALFGGLLALVAVGASIKWSPYP
jgi:Ca-activated chloride channel homolog